MANAWSILPSVFQPGDPHRTPDGTRFPSSFGAAHTTFGPSISAHAEMFSRRRTLVGFRRSFYAGTRHDLKVWDFEGRFRAPGPPITQPFIGNAMPGIYVPLDARRPCTPYRLGRQIVKAYTNLVFGHGKWPAIRVVGDGATQDFAEALATAQGLPSVMVRARNTGGSCGTAVLSWRFHDGLPRTTVHLAENIIVHSWADREELIPEHVTELYVTTQEEVDPKTKKLVEVPYWHRRDWMPGADIQYVPQPVTKNKEPQWIVDHAQSEEHGDEETHVVWIQNVPEDDSTNVDGQPDYAELWDTMDTLDLLNSVVTRAGKRNLDPTLVLSGKPELLQTESVMKGSDHGLFVGEGGTASYLELAGTSLLAGRELIKENRDHAMETAQCVAPDPDKLAAAGTSSVALKVLYQPMLGNGDVLRTQYGKGIERILEQQIRSARRRMSTAVAVYVEDEAGNEVEAEADQVLRLPPRVEEREQLDEDNNPTGETEQVVVERVPGDGGDVTLEWGEYFKPTADDRQKEVTTLSLASGGKPVMSHKTSVEIAAQRFGLDPEEEWQRICEELAAKQQQESLMTPPFGGAAGDPAYDLDQPPPAMRGPIPDQLLPTMTVDQVKEWWGEKPIGGEAGRVLYGRGGFLSQHSAGAESLGPVVPPPAKPDDSAGG